MKNAHFLCLAMLCVILSLVSQGLSQNTSRIINLDNESEDKTTAEKHCRENNKTPGSNNDKESKVSVYVLINQGPVGEIYYSNEIYGGLLEENFVKAKTENNYYYPSLYFDISATPNLSGKEIENRHLDLKWMDVEITLSKVCKKTSSCANKEMCHLWLVDMYPNASDSSTKDHPLVTGVTAAQELAGLTSPFFSSVAGQTLNAKIGAGTDGLSVLFRNVLPPIVKSSFYPRIINGRTFGWTFRQDPTKQNPTLMGLQRGLVFLQAGKGLDKIKVHYKVKTLWNKNIDNETGKLHFHERTYTIDVADLASPAAVDTTKFKSLKDYPALIKMSDVCAMFSIDKDNCKKKEQFDLIKSYLQGEDTKLSVSHPMTFVCKDNAADCEIEPDKILFKRSALQMYLDIDQEIEESKQDKN